MGMVQLDIREVIRQAIVQVKLEELGSWLSTHGTPVFYAHKNGFTVIDQKYLDSHPVLKKELEKVVKSVRKKGQGKKAGNKVKSAEQKVSYIG